MIKRLSFSLLLMGVAAFGLGAAAFAWFSTSETGNVSIATGSANISIAVDQDCDSTLDGTVDGSPFALEWHGIVPGDETRDCFTITNTGDGDLDVFVKHQNVGGNAALRSAVTFTYDNNASSADGVWCGPLVAEDFAFTLDHSERGCFIGTVAEGGILYFETRVLYADSGNQNAQQNKEFHMNAVVTGYTG